MGQFIGVSISSRTPVNRKKWAEVAVAWPKVVGIDINGLRISWWLALLSRAHSAVVPSQ